MSTLIRTSELQAQQQQQNKESMTNLKVRNSINAEQDGVVNSNRGFLSRQSMQQGRQSRTSFER